MSNANCLPNEMFEFLSNIQSKMDVAEITISDAEVLTLARERGEVLVTCNRDDFLELATAQEHCGIVILIRRRNRMMENAKLLGLIADAGESGIVGNIKFA